MLDVILTSTSEKILLLKIEQLFCQKCQHEYSIYLHFALLTMRG